MGLPLPVRAPADGGRLFPAVSISGHPISISSASSYASACQVNGSHTGHDLLPEYWMLDTGCLHCMQHYDWVRVGLLVNPKIDQA